MALIIRCNQLIKFQVISIYFLRFDLRKDEVPLLLKWLMKVGANEASRIPMYNHRCRVQKSREKKKKVIKKFFLSFLIGNDEALNCTVITNCQ